MNLVSSMLSMRGQNKGIHVGGLYHHTLILFLSKVENKSIKGVSDFHLIWTLINGYIGPHIAQVWVIFQILNAAIPQVFPSLEITMPTYLAYVEWFLALSTTSDPQHIMHKVMQLTQCRCQSAGVIPVDSIIGSTHLIPRFGHIVPQDWNSFTVLKHCDTFYINPF